MFHLRKEVKEKFFGDYEIWIDMDDPSFLSVQDVYLACSDTEAFRWNIGDSIQFSGTIDSVVSVFGSVAINLD